MFIYMVCLACVLSSVVLTAVSLGHVQTTSSSRDVRHFNTTLGEVIDDDVSGSQDSVIVAFLVTMAAIVAVVLVANIYTIASCIQVYFHYQAGCYK